MSDKMNRIYELIEDLEVLMEDGINILPGRIIVNHKELYNIVAAFKDAVPEEIQDAKVIINKKDEILQEAKLHAERIIQDAENESVIQQTFKRIKFKQGYGRTCRKIQTNCF